MVFLGFLAITIIGYLSLCLFKTQFRLLERLAIAYAIGIGFFTLLMFYISLLGGAFTPKVIGISILVIIIILVGLLVLLKRTQVISIHLKDEWKYWKEGFYKMGTLEKSIMFVLLLGIAYFLFGNITKCLYYPVSMWDALTSYDFNGRLFAEVYNIKEAAYLSAGAIQKYPLLTALSHTYVYILGGENPHFTYSLLYLCFTILFYYSLSHHVHKITALLFTFFLISTPLVVQQASEAYTNFPLTFYYGMGVIFLYNFMTLERKDYFWAATLFLSLSYWVRPEAKYFIVVTFVVFLLYCLIKRKYFHYPFILIGLFYIVGKPWEWYYQNSLTGIKGFAITETDYPLRKYSYRKDLANAGDVKKELDMYKHALFLVDYIKNSFVNALGQNDLYIFFGVIIGNIIKVFSDNFQKSSFLKYTKTAARNLKFVVQANIWMLLLLVSHVSVFVAGTIVLSTSFKEFASIQDSATRMAMIFIPLILFYCGTTKLAVDLIQEKGYDGQVHPSEEHIEA